MKSQSMDMKTESKTIKILDEDGITPMSKKNRMYVVPNGGAWREMVQRYLEKDSELKRFWMLFLNARVY
jgi:hypothetical protein